MVHPDIRGLAVLQGTRDSLDLRDTQATLDLLGIQGFAGCQVTVGSAV